MLGDAKGRGFVEDGGVGAGEYFDFERVSTWGGKELCESIEDYGRGVVGRRRGYGR